MSPIRKRLLDRLLIGTVLVVAAPAMSQVREEVRTRYPAPGIEQISVDLGFSISGPQPRFVGDVDGDGYDDFVVRLYVSQLLELDPGPESPVLVTVVYGGPRSGESERPLEGRRQSRFRFDYERFRENTEDGFFPDEYIAAVGDVDGDGFSDFCISSWEAWVDGKQRGKVLLIFGSDSFPEEIDFEDFVASGGRFVEFLGDDLVGAGPRMSEAGDLNGDGHMDLAVVDRVPDGRGEFSFTYQVDVVFGPLGANPVVSLSETGRDVPGFVFHETVDGKSYQLTPAGDLNGDGLDDLIVGGKAADDAEEFAAVIYGVREFPPDLHADQPESFGVKFLAPHGQFEIELFDARGAGDVDGDALNDFFFASQEGGEAYLVYGSRDWPSEVNVDHPSVRTSRFVETDPPVLHPEIPRIPDVAQGIPRFSLGDATAIGDWDGDGYSDLFLGNWRRTVDFGDDVGRAFVVFGGPELPARSEDRDIGTGDLPGVALFGRQPSVQFGIKAEAGGDFDGDGIEDFIVNSGNTKGSLDFTGPTIFHVLYGRRERGFPLTAAAVRPSAIPLAGGSKATLFGTGFDEDATVTVAGVPATGVEVISAAELRFTVPPGAVEGGAAVEVRSGGEVSGLPSGLTYTPVRPIEDLFLHAETLQPEAYRSLVFEDFASLASVNPAIRQFVSVFTSDINLDGLDDLLIGSPVDEGILRQGRLAVLFGSKSLPRLVGPGESGDHGTTISADSATSGRFATSVVAGDLDGDGLAEIAIGGGIEVPAQSPSSGRTIIVRGRTSWSPSIDLEEELPAGRALAIRSDGCRFPTVAGPGDFNGDGVPDLLVTSNGCVGLNAEAKLFLSGFPRGESVPEPDSILRGDPTPLTHKAINGPATRRFGWISAAGGNLNGDGVEDFIVGADHVWEHSTSSSAAATVSTGTLRCSSTSNPVAPCGFTTTGRRLSSAARAWWRETSTGMASST